MANNLDGADDASDGIHSIRGRNLGERSPQQQIPQHKGKGKLLHFIHTHTKPPLGTSAALYTILIRVQKKGRSNDTIDFLGVEKKIENDFPFSGGMIIIISVSGVCVCVCVYVETFGCLTSSKRCIKPKAAAQNAHDISQKLLTRQFRFPCWQDKVIFLFLFLAERI